MPSRPLLVTLGLAGAQAALLALTFPMDRLGTEPWHHVASLGGTLLLALAFHRPMRTRAFLALGVLATTVLALASGFYLLYWKEGIRVDGYQDWGVFWHVAWSWAAMVFFFQHSWINRVQLVRFARDTFRAWAPALLHVLPYVLGVAALWVTWGPGKSWFTNENYIPMSLWTWLAAIVPAYVLWLALRGRAGHWAVRRPVDLALVPMAALAVVSGLPLVFLGGTMDANGWKYVSKYWHVWPSVVFAVLVFVHAVQAWGTVAAHWRRLASARGRHLRPIAPTLPTRTPSRAERLR